MTTARVVRTVPAVQYDGTNGQDVLDAYEETYGTNVILSQIVSDTGTVLTMSLTDTAAGTPAQTFSYSVGDWIVPSYTLDPITDADFTANWIVKS